jgi:hypothetical protein
MEGMAGMVVSLSRSNLRSSRCNKYIFASRYILKVLRGRYGFGGSGNCTLLYNLRALKSPKHHKPTTIFPPQESSAVFPMPDTARRKCGARGANKVRTTPFRLKSKRGSKQHPTKKGRRIQPTYQASPNISGYQEQEIVTHLLYVIPCEGYAQIQHPNCPFRTFLTYTGTYDHHARAP